MKSSVLFIFLSAILAFSTNFAQAQGNPSGRGSITGDPAASSATPGTAPKSGTTTGSAARSNPSGSGTSTSGGSDANGDAGRDKMPNSNSSVRPLGDQHKPSEIR